MTKVAEFLRGHPVCCLCGGIATTIDHVPPKAIFSGKAWPEGYEFPACVSCNNGSSQIDQVSALLTRLSVADHNISADEVAKYRAGVQNNRPSSMPRLPQSEDELNAILKELGMPRPQGLHWDEVPIVTVSASAFRELDILFRKIFFALHYMHVGTIVPRDATLARICTTNQILSDENPFEWQRIPQFQNEPTIRRQGKELRHQFDYLWGVDHEGTFGFSFHIRHCIFGLIVGPVPKDRVEELPSEIRLVA